MFVDVYTAQKNGNQVLNIFLLILWISKAKNQENGLKAGYPKSPYSTAILQCGPQNSEMASLLLLLNLMSGQACGKSEHGIPKGNGAPVLPMLP